MYLIRRGFVIKPWKTREAAELIDQVAKAFENVGRSSTRVYWSGHTVPGPGQYGLHGLDPGNAYFSL